MRSINSPRHNEMSKRSIALKRTSLAFTTIAFLLLLISFVSPTWLQSWPRIHTPFDRLGLWEFCMDGFVARLDPAMTSYFGCWWIFAPYYEKIRSMLLPGWFVAVQALMSIAIIIQIICFILSLVYTCNCLRYEQSCLAARLNLYGQSLNTVLIFITGIIFGAKFNDRYWMPNPEMNWPSWGYGLAVLAGFVTALNVFPLLALYAKEKRAVGKEGGSFPEASKVKGGPERRSQQLFPPNDEQSFYGDETGSMLPPTELKPSLNLPTDASTMI